MFENVPDWLTNKVRQLPKTIDPADREAIYVHAAGWVIAQYLRMNVAAANANKFFESIPVDGVLTPAAVNRVTLIGETLFVLRSCPGFPEFCRRMRTGDLRSHFLELLEAKSFFKAGYQVYAKRETGIKGDDFDFVARRDGEQVNVEVTALSAAAFASNTVRNALDHKRRQVPTTNPAVIYCIIPEDWVRQRLDLSAALREVATHFLASTRRINFVVFIKAARLKRGDGKPGEAFLVWRDVCKNPRPRMPMKDPSFLRSGQQAQAVRDAVLSGDGLPELERRSYDSEFFRWVDHLVPKPN